MLALDLQEEKVGSRSIYESTGTVQFVFGLADRCSFNIHCTLAKRRAPNVVAVQAPDRLIADDTLCWMCTTWPKNLSTINPTIANTYAQSTTFFLYGIPYASMCACMHASLQLSELYTHAPCMPQKDFAVFAVLRGKLNVEKMASYLSVSSSFSVSAPWIITDETAPDSVEM